MDMNLIMNYVTYGLALLGGLAFVVSLIVQVIKEIPGLNELPTNVVALATAMILCPVTLVVACTYFEIVITWYYVFASLVAAFIVYLVYTGGWEKLKAILDRTKYKRGGKES